MRALYLLTLLLPMLWAKSTYFVAVPRILFAGSYSTASISISNFTQDATATISIKQRGQTLDTFSKVLPATDNIHRIAFVVNKRAGKNVQFHISCTGGVTFDHSTTLEVRVPKERLFIQTDKPIYKPGGKIRFRLVGVDKDLKPSFPQPIEQVYILNPTGSRMMQWTNTTLDVGIASFEMPLSIKPVLGKWKIVAKSGKVHEEATIKVEKYVLPKFQVEVSSPLYIVKTDTSADIKICGKYTYGKKVTGKLNAKVCFDSKYRWYLRGKNGKKCIKFQQKIDGCAVITYPLSFQNFYSYSYRYIRLKVHASITEDATGIKASSNHTSPYISNSDFTMKFVAPKTYKPGFAYKVKLLLTTPDGRPLMKRKHINVKVTYSRKNSYTRKTVSSTLRTIDNGVYEFSVTPVDSSSYQYEANEQRKAGAIKKISFKKLRVRDYNIHYSNLQRASGRSKAWYSPSKRYVKISDPINLNVGDIARVTVRFSQNSNDMKTLNYMLVCKGIVVTASTQETSALIAYLRFYVKDSMVPKCRLMVYYLHGEEFVSDSYVLNFGVSFKNKASLSFSDDEKKPGEKVNLVMKASPGSKFAVSAVDQSIKLLGETNDIQEDEIVSVLTDQDVTPSTRYERRNKCRWTRRYRRSSQPRFGYFPDDRVDGREALKQSGLKYFTNAKVDLLPCRRPVRPDIFEDRFLMVQNAGLPGPAAGFERNRVMFRKKMFKNKNVNKPKPNTKIPKKKKPTSSPKSSLKVRTEFPESWLWFDEYVGSSGEKTISVNVPDTITTWHATGFAMSLSDGIGVARPTSIKTFQPFFISLNLPYSVKRGELVKIPATVFNYLDKCLVIGLTLQSSNDFTAMTSLTSKLCVCGGKAKTVTFGIKPTKLGKIDISVHARSYEASSSICGPNEVPVSNVVAADALTKKLLVEAEGIKKEYSKSVFFCPKDYTNNQFKDKLSLHLPSNVVNGSVFAELMFVGDLLGPSMSGLDKLLAMPYGCGEQNMLKFAPNVYIMDYLKATGQSDPTIESKAITYMRSGYQRELTYKHNNGGYSAFGQRDKEASTWLTAFVLRTYAQARRYIFVDPKDIADSRRWLLSLQKSNGCFKEIGMVHHQDMKGGVTSGITMTAFVVIALLEADLPTTDSRIKKAVQCMHAQIDQINDSYTTAVLAFSLKMAGSTRADELLRKLAQDAVRNGGGLHWEDGKAKTKSADYYYYHAAKSADIEMTGYALMAYLGGKQFGTSLDHLSIVKWMTKQRNAYGGFSSTQDTCVGLQALSQYAASAFSGTYDLTIKTKQVTSNPVENEVKIDANNKLVLQRQVLSAPLPLDIEIEATGKGCALVQANVKYNEEKPGLDESFNLVTSIKQEKNSLLCRHTLKVCGSYTGQGKSNMALIDVNMVSGFEPNLDYLDMMSQMPNVPFTQYEFIDGVLSFYFESFAQTSKCVEFEIDQVAQVEDRKPAAVKIYDYYDKDNEATKMYKVGKCPEVNVVS